MSSRNTGDRLAPTPNFREQITVRTAATLMERLGYNRRRDAFCALFANAKRKPDAIYELQCVHPKRQLMDESQHTLIHDGIRAGYITRSQMVTYRAAQLLDDLACFDGASDQDDATYCEVIRNVGEAVEWLTVAKGMPTQENTERARTEVMEAAVMLELHATAYLPPAA